MGLNVIPLKELTPFKDDEIPNETEDSNLVEKAPEGTPDGGGLLVVIVHEAQDLEGKHHTNPQVRLLFRGEEKRTKVCCSLSIQEHAGFVSSVQLHRNSMAAKLIEKVRA